MAKTYSSNLEGAADSTQKAANTGLFKPAISAISSDKASQRFKISAKGNVDAYDKALGSTVSKQAAYKAMANVAASANSGAASKVGAFETTGENSTKGYIQGILKYIKETGEAGAAIGATALKALEKKLETGSPSKEFARLGKYSSQGFANGVTDYTKDATNAVSTMANKVIETARRATDMSNRIILNGTIADPTVNRVSVPTTNNAGYGIGTANEGAMASLASNIYQAVVSGIAGANIGGNGNGGDIKVIIDGKEVFKAVQTESRKRGVAISNGTFSR